ncbi:MAG: carboxypeptidase regulatory-like domain-containing protein [Gemmatimonadaceae bacterium]
MATCRRDVLSILMVVFAGVGLALPSSGQAVPTGERLPAYRDRLLGVYSADTGEPIEAAEVQDISSRESILTSKTGTATLRFLPEGGTLLRIRHVGYEPVMIAVEISPGQTVPLTVLMHAAAQTLPTVVTKDSAPTHIAPGLREFEERRKTGIGHFISEAELRKNENRKMTDLIRQLPAIGVVCPTSGVRRGECWAISRRLTSRNAFVGSGGCDVDLYLDGVLMTDNDLEQVRASTLAGVEYYAGGATIPPEYNRTGASCGVLLFWSRDR